VPDRPTLARRCVILAGVLVMPVLWGFGKVGGGRYVERIREWTVVVRPGESGVGVYEAINMDFGNERRRGIQRAISNSLGVPPEVGGYPLVFLGASAEPNGGTYVTYDFTPQATTTGGSVTEAELTARHVELTGVEQFIAVYTLPAVLAVGDRLDYEVILPDRPVDARKVTVVIDEVQLADPSCTLRSGHACELRLVDGHYEARFATLDADDGVTIGGTITARTERHDVDMPDGPRSGHHNESDEVAWLTLCWLAPLGGYLGFVIARSRRRRQRGRRLAERVRAAEEDRPVDRLGDGDGATPHSLLPLPSIEPWMGTALLREAIGEQSAAVWFARQVADGVLCVEEPRGQLGARFVRGERFGEAPHDVQVLLGRMLGRKGSTPTAPFLPSVHRVIRSVNRRQRFTLRGQPWWRRFGPGSRNVFSWPMIGVGALWASVLTALVLTRWTLSWPVAAALLFFLPASVSAAAVYFLSPQGSDAGEEAVAALLPLRDLMSRSRTEDVEAAWHRGQLTEYCIWAVALECADPWHSAIRASSIPREDVGELVAPMTFGLAGGGWRPVIADSPVEQPVTASV